MRKIVPAVLMALLCGARAGAINLHELNGSDLGMGVGARAIGMAGAFTALADDAAALYWNPAGITEMPRREAMFMVDMDPTRYSYKALVFRPKSWDDSELRPTFGIARTNRLKYVGEGKWWEGNAGHLVDLSMISLDWKTYDGGLNSRTNDWRVTFASRVPRAEKLSIGMTYIDFKCVTTFYATNSGRTCQIVSYETMDFGLLYRAGPSRSVGLSLRNPLEKTKPKYLNLGYARRKGNSILTLDVERIFGNYSHEMRTADFLMVRAGAERDLKNGWKLRGGMLIPLRAKTSTLGDIYSRIPSPKVDIALGAGYEYKNYIVDFAVYGDPGRGYVNKELKAGSVLTMRYRF